MGNPKIHITNPPTGTPLCQSDTTRVTLIYAEVTCRRCLAMHKNNTYFIQNAVVA